MSRAPLRLARQRAWLPVLLISLLAGHGVIVYNVSSHWTVSGAVVFVVVLLLGIRHVGLLGPVYALYRRRRRSRSGPT